MKQVVVITPADARPGFELAGVRQRVASPASLQRELQALLEDATVGLVIVDERLLTDETQAALAAIERRTPGLVVRLPAPEAGAGREEDYVSRLIRRAIGYQVRLGA